MTTPSRDLLRTVADTLIDLPYEAWNFGDSIAFEGMVAASRTLRDQRWLDFAHGFIRAWSANATPFRRLDCTAPGLAMIQVYEHTGDPLVLEGALRLAAYLIDRPLIGPLFATWEQSPLQRPYGPGDLPPDEVALLVSAPPGAFIDCLHFDPPFLVAAGRTVGNRAYVDEGIAQARGYVDLLQSPSGTFDHFVLEDMTTTYGAGWGRGQGWALLGLLDVIARLDAPEDAAARDELAAAAYRLIKAMMALQRDDGHWYAVVDDPESGDETSTAAFMADGFARATALGLVEGTDVLPAAQRALEAALAATTSQGILTGVSAAVNACTKASHYAHVPRGFVVPWGQGPMAMAVAAHLSVQEVTA